MPTHHRKHHHPLSKSFEGQFDHTEAAAASNKQEAKDQRTREQARIRVARYRARKKEAAAASNKQEAKDQRTREQARIRVARYRARKKEKTAQEEREKLDQEAKDQRRREQARIRSARYLARKKETTVQEEKEKLAQEKVEEDVTTKGIIKEKKTDQLEEHCAAKKKEEKMILQGDSNNNNNIHDITTFAAPPTPSSAALTTSNYPANSSLSTPLRQTDCSKMNIMHAGGGGGRGTKLSTPVDVLKARVDVTYHLSDIIKESAKDRVHAIDKRINEIADREKKLTHVCQARDEILKCLYDEMKSEQSYLHPPITDAEQSGRTSTTKRRNISSTTFPAVIDCHETPARTIKMPRLQEHISNDGATMHRTGHEEDIAADEKEDATMENATEDSTTATLREHGGVAYLAVQPNISSPFPSFHLDGKFSIGSAGHSSSSDKRKKKARGKSNYKK